MDNTDIIDNEDIIDNQDINIDELDSTWLHEFDNLDKEYKSYYAEEPTFIRCHSIYINKLNEIEKIKEDQILFKTPSILPKEELLAIIKHNSFSNEIKYSLLSILKYNLNCDPKFLKTFLKSKKNIGSSYLQSITNIDTIKFDKTISMFHDINDLFLLFYEKSKKISSSSITKKHFHSLNTNKKTKRKPFKELIA
jgi:hypothetical protein